LVPELSSYDYAVVRLVPDLDRGEFVNVGVVLFSKARGSLLAMVGIDDERLGTLASGRDVPTIRAHLASIERIAEGGPEAGSLGHLSASQRFHWLVSPRSTMIQVSPVHSGLCADPRAELERLYRRLVHPAATL
jgi:Protein of unknown function (DUF3037)